MKIYGIGNNVNTAYSQKTNNQSQNHNNQNLNFGFIDYLELSKLLPNSDGIANDFARFISLIKRGESLMFNLIPCENGGRIAVCYSGQDMTSAGMKGIEAENLIKATGISYKLEGNSFIEVA